MITERRGCRPICTVLLDPRDPLLRSERTQGFTAGPDYWKGEVCAYVGRNQNLKDLKDGSDSATDCPAERRLEQYSFFLANKKLPTPIGLPSCAEAP